MTSPDIYDRLENWARWSRNRRASAKTCYSAEGRYRPELLRGDAEVDRRTPIPSVDSRDALLVFRAIGPAHGFPKRWFIALSAVFIERLPVGYQLAGYMRKHGIPVTRSEPEQHRLILESVSAAGAAITRADRRLIAFDRTPE